LIDRGKECLCEISGESYSLTTTMPTPDVADFLLWFQSEGGYVDLSAMDIVNFPSSEGGRGGIALKDIPVSRIYSLHLETDCANWKDRRVIPFFRYHGHLCLVNEPVFYSPSSVMMRGIRLSWMSTGLDSY